MMTTQTEHDRGRVRTTLFPLRPDQLLPQDLAAEISDRVSEANRAAMDAFGRYEETTRKARELAEQARHAENFDRHTILAAEAAGEKPPKPTQARKEAAADEARGLAEAAEVVAKQRLRALYDAVEDDRDRYVAACRRRAADAPAPMDAPGRFSMR